MGRCQREVGNTMCWKDGLCIWSRTMSVDNEDGPTTDASTKVMPRTFDCLYPTSSLEQLLGIY